MQYFIIDKQFLREAESLRQVKQFYCREEKLTEEEMAFIPVEEISEDEYLTQLKLNK